MTKQYKSKFKYPALLLIEQGYSNKEITVRLGCNSKYPAVMRSKLRKMSEKEQRALFEEARQNRLDENKRTKEQEGEAGMSTPTKIARGKAFISRY